MMTGVGSMIGNESMQSCNDVAHLCYNDPSKRGKIARLICAPTCGMAPSARGEHAKGGDMSARSGLFLDSQDDGVPVACRTGFALSLWHIPCRDENATQTGWKRYADGVA